MQNLYRGVTWRRDTGVLHNGAPVAYLTFDDGPIPEATPAILDVLAKYGVKGTFFMVGDNIRKYPHIYARVIREGHRVGNHTMHHIKGTQNALRLFTHRGESDKYLQDIEACEQVMNQYMPNDEHTTNANAGGGQGSERLFRPPYGKMTFRQKRAVLERGYRIILWDVLTHDYNPRFSPEHMLRIVQRYTRNGSIINFHDSIKSAERTVAVLPMVIQWLQAEGYQIEVL